MRYHWNWMKYGMWGVVIKVVIGIQKGIHFEYAGSIMGIQFLTPRWFIHKVNMTSKEFVCHILRKQWIRHHWEPKGGPDQNWPLCYLPSKKLRPQWAPSLMECSTVKSAHIWSGKLTGNGGRIHLLLTMFSKIFFIFIPYLILLI